MLRRDAIRMLIGTLTMGAFAAPASSTLQPVRQFGGIVPTPTQRQQNKRQPSFRQKFPPLHQASSVGKNVFLWKNLEKEIGHIAPHDQLGVDGEREGDCGAHAGCMGCDVLAASDIHYLRQAEQWNAKASVESAYWGSRVQIGKSRLDPEEWDRFKTGDGSTGAWIAAWFNKFGVLHRQVYRDGPNSIDLTGYDAERSRERRNTGVPAWLLPIAKEHPVKEISNIKSGRQALDAVVVGQPVLLCSSYGFENTRDDQGFAKPLLNRWRYENGLRVPWRQWWHAMVLTGALLEGGRIGGLVQNSHGVWNSGPRPYDIPEGSFFVDLKYLDIMVKDWYDCWALSGYEGHLAKTIRKHILYLR